ncbi:YlbF family regulator [Holzapfeliella sp. He02]|uniref:UPF0342 protein R4Y45_05360 n=1 Tax=Holzapfeliella saturejae TaxID=3082953 RepID=A0ABU8SGY8_9LACO
MNIYDTINQLAAELKETSEYKDLQASYEKLSQNEEAFKLFKEVNSIQKDLQAKQMSGQELTQEDMAKANELGQQMEKTEEIVDLMSKEQSMQQLFQDINSAVSKSMDELYHDLNN